MKIVERQRIAKSLMVGDSVEVCVEGLGKRTVLAKYTMQQPMVVVEAGIGFADEGELGQGIGAALVGFLSCAPASKLP